MRVTNLPEVKDAHKIECRPTEHGGYEFWCDNWLVARSDAATLKGVADGLAHIMADTYRRGFEKGREHVRDALGIPKQR